MMQCRIVCPLFEPFLTWLYTQDTTDIDKLPDIIEFDVKDAPCELRGYRRPGPEDRTVLEAMPKKRDKKKKK